MKTAYVFPGQGSQFTGMAKDLYDENPAARELLEQANDILGFRITDIMFEGSAEDLKQTKVTQPAVFLHSVVAALCGACGSAPANVVAGHSLGEFSALAACGALSFEDALRLVSIRAAAMQKACDNIPGSMAVILGLEDDIIMQTCENTPGTVVAANFNCPGQVAISGTAEAVAAACESLKAAGSRRAMLLPVSGAFHSPLMEPAREELARGIESVTFNTPRCPIYQNVSGESTSDPALIKANLLSQLTSPVLWTQSVRNMAADGVDNFLEFGPGSVLTGLIRKILA